MFKAFRNRAAVAVFAASLLPSIALADFNERKWFKSMEDGARHLQRGAAEKSVKAYSKALALEPAGQNRAVTLIRLADAFIANEKFGDALGHVDEALTLIEPDESLHSPYFLALQTSLRANVGLGQYDKAKARMKSLSAIRQIHTQVWQTKKNGDLEHQLFDVTFPQKTRGFSRGDAQIYDDYGLLVGVPYEFESGKGPVVLTTYLSDPAAADADEVLADAESALRSRIAGASEFRREPYQVKVRRRTIVGERVSYALTRPGSDQRLLTEVYVFSTENAIVKYRVSYESALAKTVGPKITQFIKKFDWPK